MVWTQHGKVFQYELFICFVSHHEEILVRDDRAKTFVGATDKALTRAKYIEELFRIIIFAERPEAATDAASHDDAVVVHNIY